jgi:hypothetical protein
MELIERYCIKNDCYYHGTAQVCPECGKVTHPCKEGTYVPEKGYSLREIGG